MNEDEKAPRMRLALAQGVAFAFLAGATLLAPGRNQKAFAAPKTYTKYTAVDKAFACDAPEGWEKSEAGGNGLRSGVMFKSGKAVIDIDADLQGSLMADVSRAQDAQLGGGQMAPPKPPVEKLHMAHAEVMEEKYEDYQEQPMRDFPCTLGDARVSEFTGVSKKGMGKRHGLRATVLSGERRITVLCATREQDYKTLVPAFSRVMRSLAPGGN